MKKTTYIVTKFDIEDDGFYVEVTPITNDEGVAMYDFYLCKDDYGIKELMFGLYAEDCPPSEWEDMIEANVYQYIASFIEDTE